jgi:lactoylglutathione lyase
MWTSMMRIGLFVAAGIGLFGGEALAADWHHLHLTAEDSKAGAEWYAKHMEGQYEKNGAFDVAAFGKTSILFFKKGKGFPGSEGSAVDHIGFSFADLDAKMKQLEGEGVKIVAPARSFGKIKFAFVEDPWGTKIEVMQDPDLYGFHHIHLHTGEPMETLKWYADAFGGEITKYMGALPAIRYGDMWLIAMRSKKELAPTKDRSVDHLGWSFPDLDAAAKELKGKGVKFTLGPIPFGSTKIAFIDGPDGVRIELVQRREGSSSE